MWEAKKNFYPKFHGDMARIAPCHLIRSLALAAAVDIGIFSYTKYIFFVAKKEIQFCFNKSKTAQTVLLLFLFD